jgi:hypothetical protein
MARAIVSALFQCILFSAPGAVYCASVSVNTTTANNLDWIRVSFTFPAGDNTTWIGLYGASQSTVAIDPLPYPATAPWTKNAPIKYAMLSSLGVDFATGVGTWDAEIINGYSSLVFWLFTNGITKPVTLAHSDVVYFYNSPPLRGHIAGTGIATELRVTWHSNHTSDTGASVRYGPSPDSMTSVSPANGTTYTQSDLCGPPATTHGWWPANAWYSAGAGYVSLCLLGMCSLL